MSLVVLGLNLLKCTYEILYDEDVIPNCMKYQYKEDINLVLYFYKHTNYTSSKWLHKAREMLNLTDTNLANH